MFMLVVGMAALGLRVGWGQPPSEDETQIEYNIKLAFLCNFGRYVTWPADAPPRKDDTLIIGVLGDDPFHGRLDQIAAAGRKVQGQVIVARHFTRLSEYQPCHVLFIAKTVSPDQQADAIRTLRGKPVLLVGEVAGFAARKGCINFYRDGDNVRFEINPEAVRGQELQASSKLLTLAKIVKAP
jgi:hypothetical protein